MELKKMKKRRIKDFYLFINIFSEFFYDITKYGRNYQLKLYKEFDYITEGPDKEMPYSWVELMRWIMTLRIERYKKGMLDDIYGFEFDYSNGNFIPKKNTCPECGFRNMWHKYNCEECGLKIRKKINK